ncbi:hypothetical protein NXH76_17670 [Blautia schinkii]|nr:hypothetical protein [Blautia schinkii]
MGEKLNGLLIGVRIRMQSFWDAFLHEEKGAAEIVAIILIIVVVIACAVIFREKITSLVKGVFESDDFKSFTGD